MDIRGRDTGRRDFKTGLANKTINQTPRRAAPRIPPRAGHRRRSADIDAQIGLLPIGNGFYFL
jgi:hypothetical protein